MPDLKTFPRGTLIILAAGMLLFLDSFLAWQKIKIEFAGVTAVEASHSLWDSGAGVIAGLALVVLLAWILMRAAKVNFLPNVSDRTMIGCLAGVVFILVLLKNLVDDFSAWPSYVGVVLAGVVLFGALLYLREEPEPAPAEPAPVEPT